MATITTFGAQKESTQITQGARASNAPAGAFGGAVAKGLGDVAKAVDDISTRIDTTAAEDALNQFEREKNDILFAPETGYYNTAGVNAYDGAGATNESLTKLKDKYASGLSSEQSKTMFSRSADVQLKRSDLDIKRHAAKGFKTYELSTLNASVENTIENAVLLYNNPKDLTVQNAKGRLDIIDAADMEGISGEAKNEKLQTYDSSFYSAAVGAATRSTSEEGSELLEKHKGQIEGPDLLKLQNDIATKAKAEKVASDNRESVVTSTKLINEYDGNRTKINEQINNIKDPDLRSKTKREAHWQLDQKNKADDEERTEIYDTVDKAGLGGMSTGEWIALPGNSEKWEKLTGDQQRDLTSGKKVTTNWDVYNRLTGLPAAQLAKVNPGDYVTQIGKAEFGKLKTSIDKARNDERDSIGQNRAQMAKTVSAQLFGKTSGSKSKTAKNNAFMQAVNDAVDQYEADTGKVADGGKYKEILNGLTREHVQEGRYFGLFDSDTDIKEIKPENLTQLSGALKTENQRIDIDSIARLRNGVAANRDELEQALNERGIPVNMTTLSRAYLRAVAANK